MKPNINKCEEKTGEKIAFTAEFHYVSPTLSHTLHTLLSHLVYRSSHLVEVECLGETQESIDLDPERSALDYEPTDARQDIELPRLAVNSTVKGLLGYRFQSGFLHVNGLFRCIRNLRRSLRLEGSNTSWRQEERPGNIPRVREPWRLSQ